MGSVAATARRLAPFVGAVEESEELVEELGRHPQLESRCPRHAGDPTAHLPARFPTHAWLFEAPVLFSS